MGADVLRLVVGPLVVGLRLDQNFFGVRSMSQHGRERKQHGHDRHRKADRLLAKFLGLL